MHSISRARLFVRFVPTLLLTAGLLAAPGVSAAIKTWSGAANGNWGSGANWTNGIPPANGDILIFPSGAANLLNTNNLAGLRMGSITFSGSGYTLRGSTLILSNGISAQHASGLNVVEFAISNAVSQTFNCVNAGARLTVSGNIFLENTTLTVTGSGSNVLSGIISGTGGVTKSGTGPLAFTGSFANQYTGTTTVNAGSLLLHKIPFNAAFAGPLVIGDGAGGVGADVVRLMISDEIPESSLITINGSGLLDLNNTPEMIGDLVLNAGGNVQAGTSILTLTNTSSVAVVPGGSPLGISEISGGLQLTASHTFTVSNGVFGPDLELSGQVSGPGGILKNGTGTLDLLASNTFAGAVTINAGSILAGDNSAMGTTAAGTVVNDGGTLEIGSNVHVGTESLSLAGFGTLGLGALIVVGGSNSWAGNITLVPALADPIINVNLTRQLNLSGAISGTAGLSKVGTGTLIYSGGTGNTYAGSTDISIGTLLLNKGPFNAAFGGSLVIGNNLAAGAAVVRLALSDEIPDTSSILIHTNGTLDLNNLPETVGLLSFTGGAVTTGTGLLTLSDDLRVVSTALQTATISGRLNPGSISRLFSISNAAPFDELVISAEITGASGIIKQGAGRMSLTSSNSYTSSTLIQAGELRIAHPNALGFTAIGTTVASGASLLCDNVSVAGEPLILNGNGFSFFGALTGLSGSNYWGGSVTLNTACQISSVAPLNLAGIIGGPATLTKIGGGALMFSGSTTNTYTGATFVNEGSLLLAKTVARASIHGPLVAGDGSGGDLVRMTSAFQLETNVPVTVNFDAVFDVNSLSGTIGSLAGLGNMTLGSAILETGADNTSTLFGGLISGSGALDKIGTGTLTLNGNNTYTLESFVLNGTLLVNGFQPDTPLRVFSGATLGGSGQVNTVRVTGGGTLAPGTSPGRFTASNTVFSAASTFIVELNGATVATGYDQLYSYPSNNLGGATLVVVPSFSAVDAPEDGDLFEIIAGGFVTNAGTFAGLPDGAVFTAGGTQFRINYASTPGSVTLTVTNTPLVPGSTTLSSGNSDGFIDPNECNLLNIVISNRSLTPVTGISATLSVDTPGVVVTQPLSPYADITGGSRGTNALPFQFSLQPGFECGRNVDLRLVVATASHGTFTLPLSLPSGAPAAAVRFDNNTVLGIPDPGSQSSMIEVTNITAPIAKVTVALHFTHPSADDLDVHLMAPDGTIVELTTDNGGTGDDYGTACTDGARTVFDDAASTAITAGSVPFVGTFRPEGALADFIGRDANGFWTLFIDDDTPGSAGSLRCWSLFISPATCSTGGGECDVCPDITVAGFVGSSSPLQQERFVRTGNISTCAAPTTCPGIYGSISFVSYESHTFQNGPSNACITVTLQTPSDVALFSAAYLGSFNPTNLCENYLGDSGDSTIGLVYPFGSRTYSFEVGAFDTFEITVNAVPPGTSPGAYQLAISGGDCRPVLNISKAGTDNVVLDWSSTAIGYLLESTNVLGAGNSIWSTVSNAPVVVDGRFQVTNSVASGTNRFYWLRKPLP